MRRSPVSVIELAGYGCRVNELLTNGEQEAIIDFVAYGPDCGDVISGIVCLPKMRSGRSGMASAATRAYNSTLLGLRQCQSGHGKRPQRCQDKADIG